MEVRLAKTAGFCFGVKRAVETVYEQAQKRSDVKIYTYGPIIHNEEVVKDMEAHGVKVLHSEEELKGLEEGLVSTAGCASSLKKRFMERKNWKNMRNVH